MAKNIKFIELNQIKQDELRTKISKEQLSQFGLRTEAERKYQELLKGNISEPMAREQSGLKRMDDALKSLNDELDAAKRMEGYSEAKSH